MLYTSLVPYLPGPSGLSVHQADLSFDAGWAKAVEGCEYVLHIASPFPSAQPKDPEAIIAPARDGTQRVIEASLAAGVQRIVITSSAATVHYAPGPPRQLTEDDWTDTADPRLNPYERSKTIAEKIAWHLVDDAGRHDRLTVVVPSTMLGPLIGDRPPFSFQVIQRMLDGMPGTPRLADCSPQPGFTVCGTSLCQAFGYSRTADRRGIEDSQPPGGRSRRPRCR